MKSSDRIERLFTEFVLPELNEKGFQYVKSNREFRKSNELFDFHVTWEPYVRNNGSSTVDFTIGLGVTCPAYRKWEKKFYGLNKVAPCGGAITGEDSNRLEGWDKSFYGRGSWYSLAKFDNEALMKNVRENVLEAGFSFFRDYTSYDSAINQLKRFPVRHLERITDLYLMQGRRKEAFDFFEENQGWHEERLKDDHAEHAMFMANRKERYRLRKLWLKSWAQGIA